MLFRRLYFLVVGVLFVHAQAHAQTMYVQPYLQDAEPDRMTILWETTSGTESTVQYGATAGLGLSVSGTSFVSNGAYRMHSVTLTGLSPATKYFYKAVTGPAQSAALHFRTPALASAEAPTNIAAMSDMQRDGSQPNKFWEVVHNGVIEHVNDSMGPDLSQELAMVVIPGDLVDNGTNFASWKTTFFDPADPLFSYVPVYPVLGNHENNTVNYFNYFQLPENGTPGYAEHWWYKDHSNVRIIGLNSNSGYRIQEQLDWLDGVLADACSNSTIDFVFAQLHHPHHSELWIAGNTDYTGEVIQRMEQFSTSCGKPSIHFFGHTHGYSRGQSRDHSHLMVNVATAGGSIDYWGEFANFDYPEYSISMDEYGFVMVEVQAGADPKFVVKRYNIGDATASHPTTLDDMISVRRYNNAPATPVCQFPLASDVVSPDCVVLKATSFFDADGDAHGDSHWQVSTVAGDWSAPIVDSWKQYQNWYYEVDEQANDDLSDERVTGLAPNTTYYWRVRYRDRSLRWSNWSTTANFATTTSQNGPNLLANGNAENGTTGWIATDGVIESLTSGECNGIAPYAGTRYFALGALCTDNAFGRAYQDVSVVTDAAEIDNGVASLRYGGYFANWQGSDLPKMALEFRNAGGTVLGSAPEIGSNTGTWTLAQNDVPIPIGTRIVRVILTGTREVGSDNDSYMDDLFAHVVTGAACSEPYVYVPMRTFLQGPFDTDTEMMHDDLRVQGLIPLTEPFTALGFSHAGEGGGETIDASVLQPTGINAVVDWVLVELRTGTAANTVIATRSCLVLRGGTVVDKDGSSTPRITAPPGSYHIVLRHRNHLGVMTALPIVLGGSQVTIDLSDPIVSLYGTEAMETIGNVRVQWSGNSTADNELRYTGTNNDRDPILEEIGGVVPTAIVNGYFSTDANMDGNAKYTGLGNDRDIVLTNIGGVVPTAVRVEQVP